MQFFLLSLQGHHNVKNFRIQNFFCSVVSRIRTICGNLQSWYLHYLHYYRHLHYSVCMQEITNQSKPRIRTFFTQCIFSTSCSLRNIFLSIFYVKKHGFASELFLDEDPGQFLMDLSYMPETMTNRQT